MYVVGNLHYIVVSYMNICIKNRGKLQIHITRYNCKWDKTESQTYLCLKQITVNGMDVYYS